MRKNEKKRNILVLCGCRKHHVPRNDNISIFWNGSWWSPKCVTEEFNKINKENCLQIVELRKYYLKYKVLEKKISTLPCGLCGFPLGKGFEFYGQGIYCKKCMTDHGGEN